MSRRRMEDVISSHPWLTTLARPRKHLLEHPKSPPLYPRVDVVVSRMNEDIDWIQTVSAELPQTHFIVYEKNASNRRCYTALQLHCVLLKNVGRESNTYLYHIVKNYHRLADKTVFMQAAFPGWGWYPPHVGGHVQQGSDVMYDYLSAYEPPRIVFTWAYHTSESHELSIRRSTFPVIAPWSGGYWMVQDPFLLNDTLPGVCPNPNEWVVTSNRTLRFWDTLVPKQAGQVDDLRTYWNRYLKAELGPLPSDAYMVFSNGALFSASSWNIQSHTRQFWKTLLQTTNDLVNPRAGFYLEMVWPYLVGFHDVAWRCSASVSPQFWLKTKHA